MTRKATTTTRARPTAAPRVPERVTQAQFAGIVGVTRQTVAAWCAQGLPTSGRTGKQLAHEIPLAAGVQWRLAQLEARVAEAEARDPDVSAARRKKLEVETQILEDRRAAQQGAVVPREDVARLGRALSIAWAAMVSRYTREAIGRGVPSRYAPILDQLARDVRTAISQQREIEVGEFSIERFDPQYWTAAELRARLDTPSGWPGMLLREDERGRALWRQLAALADAGRGIVLLRDGAWWPWPLTGDEEGL